MSPQHVDLDLPGDPAVMSLARMTVGVVGAQADMGLEDLDDLRLALEELCLSMWRQAPSDPARMLFRFVWEEGCVEVTCSMVTRSGSLARTARREPADEIDGLLPEDLSRQILETLVDDHDVTASGDVVHGWVRKGKARFAPLR